MKRKLGVLLALMFFITGCSNYNELNDLAIVGAIGIEKQEEDFKVTLEVFKEEKQSDSGAASKKSLAIKGVGKSLDEAINDAAFMSEKLLFFPHLEAIIIDSDLAKEGINDIMDYLSRYTDFSFQSYVVLSDEVKPSDLLEKKKIDTEIIADSIYAIFNNIEQNNSAFVYNHYFDFLEQYINPYEDIYLPYVKVKDKKIQVEDAGIFKEDKLVNKIKGTDTKSLSLFTGNTDSLYYNVKCHDGYIVFRLFEAKSKYKISDDKITIEVNTTSGIDEVNCHINTVEVKNIEKIDTLLEKSIKKDLTDFINNLKENKVDVLGLNNKIYKRYGYVKKNWLDYDIEIKVSDNITKKGVLMNYVRDKS